MAEWWVGPLVTIIVAIVAASGAWLTIFFTRRQAERARTDARLTALEARNDLVNRRNFMLINYAQRLRDHIYQQKPPPPEEWPEDLYDQP